MQTVASVVVLAGLYVLLGVGYVLVYRASRVLNLAQGDLMMLGGYALYATATTVSASPAVAVPAALAVGALTGVLVSLLLMRPMAGHPIFAAVLVTVSLGILLRVAVVLAYTDQIRYPAQVMALSNGAALLCQPRVLLVDELSLGLAPLVVKGLMRVLARLREELGLTILLVEQNVGAALAVADHGYVIEHGRIVYDGTAEQLRGHEDVREFYLGLGRGAAATKSYRDVKQYRRRRRWFG